MDFVLMIKQKIDVLINGYLKFEEEKSIPSFYLMINRHEGYKFKDNKKTYLGIVRRNLNNDESSKQKKLLFETTWSQFQEGIFGFVFLLIFDALDIFQIIWVQNILCENFNKKRGWKFCLASYVPTGFQIKNTPIEMNWNSFRRYANECASKNSRHELKQ